MRRDDKINQGRKEEEKASEENMNAAVCDGMHCAGRLDLSSIQ